jgi:hypothetical protein
MPAGDIYEASYNATYVGQNIATVFHFVQIGADGAGDARDSVNLMFANQFEAAILTGLTDGVVSTAIRSRRLFPTQTQALTLALAAAGTVLNPGLPPNQVGILRTYGPLLGRRGIGRVTVTGIPTEDVNEGRLNIDQIAFRNVLAAALELDQADGVSTFLWHAAVLSRVDNIARQINHAGILTQIKNLRSRTRSA